jgi:hypothetical protein
LRIACLSLDRFWISNWRMHGLATLVPNNDECAMIPPIHNRPIKTLSSPFPNLSFVGWGARCRCR